MEKIQVNAQGYYGKFGGAYVPEMLYPNVEELQRTYTKIMYEEKFQKQFKSLLISESVSLIKCAHLSLPFC